MEYWIYFIIGWIFVSKETMSSIMPNRVWIDSAWQLWCDWTIVCCRFPLFQKREKVNFQNLSFSHCFYIVIKVKDDNSTHHEAWSTAFISIKVLSTASVSSSCSQLSHFRDEETEAQKGQVAWCQQSYHPISGLGSCFFLAPVTSSSSQGTAIRVPERACC